MVNLCLLLSSFSSRSLSCPHNPRNYNFLSRADRISSRPSIFLLTHPYIKFPHNRDGQGLKERLNKPKLKIVLIHVSLVLHGCNTFTSRKSCVFLCLFVSISVTNMQLRLFNFKRLSASSLGKSDIS